MPSQNVLSFEGVTKTFETASATDAVRAVSEVSLQVRRGETLAIVGESGSGKSTLVRLLMKLESPSSGRIFLDQGGVVCDIAKIATSDFYRRVQMVFQDPYGSLNGRRRVWEIVSAGVAYLGLKRTRADLREAAEEALASVGLPAAYLDTYPDHLSGGQRQRVSIARALAARPEILVLDEPLSALDVSVQAQIVNLLLELQERMKLTYLFISHDLAVVRHIADTVAVMRSGQLIEVGPVEDVIDRPAHSYTQALVGASFAVRSVRSEPREQGVFLDVGASSMQIRGIA
ncbi:ATP-binding cassette domain-containing protein [Pseudomonas amygdali]|uniref:ATP-binding cassette domain-containing protein n=1 Tax=Pseudomonas amygdali TaxID=47877 RepID=UPI0006B971F1|nr:ATP-binding cassette domain-containing protein [Pseudomonas amygdali]